MKGIFKRITLADIDKINAKLMVRKEKSPTVRQNLARIIPVELLTVPFDPDKIERDGRAAMAKRFPHRTILNQIAKATTEDESQIQLHLRKTY